MRIIVDADRVVAALIKQNTTRDILFDEAFEFLTPDYALSEIEEHREILQKKTKLAKDEFDILLSLIFEYITIIAKSTYTNFMEDCKESVKDVDDIPYIAACLASKSMGIWSHDQHFREQSKVKVFTNIDLLNLSR